jgi:hypothetical protein
MEARRGVSRTPRSVACRRNLPRSRQSQSAFQGHPSYECAGRVCPDDNVFENWGYRTAAGHSYRHASQSRKRIDQRHRLRGSSASGRIAIGNDSAHVQDARGRLAPALSIDYVRFWCGIGMPSNVSRRSRHRTPWPPRHHAIELIPDETSVSHSFLRVAGEQAVVMRTSLWRRPFTRC